MRCRNDTAGRQAHTVWQALLAHLIRIRKEPLAGLLEFTMAGYAGLEPATSDVTGRRSNQLS